MLFFIADWLERTALRIVTLLLIIILDQLILVHIAVTLVTPRRQIFDLLHFRALL